MIQTQIPTTMTDLVQIPSSSSPHFPHNERGCGSLKRKRPPGIKIPNVLREICADVAEKGDVSFSGPGVGVVSVKGKKRFMEDTYKIVSCHDGIKGFFGVYDGHGGRKAADFVAENLHTNIFKVLENRSEEDALKSGYLKTDEEFLKQGVPSGACCVTALIKGNDIIVSNIGDCRAVLCKGGIAKALTRDHRAGDEDERKRIDSKGGYVQMHRGAWRVHGTLTVSRSIGDAHLKEWVVADPNTKTLTLSPDMDYLILASDGLWEEVGNQEAVDIVMGTRKTESKPGVTNHDVDVNYKKLSLLNYSLASELQSISLSKQKKKDGLSLSKHKAVVQRQGNELGFPSENKYPLLKTPKIPSQCSFQENSKHKTVQRQENEYEFPSHNKYPSLKTPKVPSQCSYQENSKHKAVQRQENEYEFPSENKYPSLKTPKTPSQCSYEEDSTKPAESCELVDACNELVKLAVSRGSLDDITVMIVDLNIFK